MLTQKPKKNIFAKATLDTLDFIEYFCNNEDKDLVWSFVGYLEAQIALVSQTLNPKYANKIASKMGLEPVNFKTSSFDVLDFLLKSNMSKEAMEYLITDRKFPLELCDKYLIKSFCPSESYIPEALKNFYLFDLERLEYLSYVLEQLNIKVDLTKTHFLIMPSFDHTGQLNNLAFRTLDTTLESQVFKWLFSYGRQSTFGLNHCYDKNKPITIVEGFFDYVACKEAGVCQPVALGSAFFSDLHLDIFAKAGFKLNVLFDSDETGKKYAQSLSKIYQVDKILVLDDEYKDPYDWWINTGTIKYSPSL
jgi:DNA primase